MVWLRAEKDLRFEFNRQSKRIFGMANRWRTTDESESSKKIFRIGRRRLVEGEEKQFESLKGNEGT
jgi:hypothetical protein